MAPERESLIRGKNRPSSKGTLYTIQLKGAVRGSSGEDMLKEVDKNFEKTDSNCIYFHDPSYSSRVICLPFFSRGIKSVQRSLPHKSASLVTRMDQAASVDTFASRPSVILTAMVSVMPRLLTNAP